MKFVPMTLLFLLLAGLASAALAVPQAPEIDPGSASSALALLSGASLILASRRKK